MELTTDVERLLISLTVLIGGGAMLMFGPPDRISADAIVALFGLVVGWWLPRGNGNGTKVVAPPDKHVTADMQPWEGR